MMVDMPRYHTRLIARETIAHKTMAFHIKKPEGFSFQAGQHIDVEITNPPRVDKKGVIRPYSIASAPHEKNILIATRISDSAFKEHMFTSTLPLPLYIEGPMGSFALHKDTSKPAVFLAGGIGITPFRSIIYNTIAQRLPHSLYLLFSNRTPDDAPFTQELTKLSQQHKKFLFLPTMTGTLTTPHNSGSWQGATGYIDFAMIHASLKNPADALFYIAGPPSFVKAMRDMLGNNGIMEDNIRSEEFSGY